MTASDWLIVDLLIYIVPLSILLLTSFVAWRRQGKRGHNDYGDDSKLGDCPICKRPLPKNPEQRHADHPSNKDGGIARDSEIDRQIFDQVHGGSSSLVGSVGASNHSGAVSPRQFKGGEA